MRIAVYGATGMIGSAVAAEAIARGHEVSGVSRRGRPVDGRPEGLRWSRGDAADPASVRAVAAEHDLVVSATGPSREPAGDPNAFLDVVRTLITGVGATRLVMVGGAGSLIIEDGSRLMDAAGFPVEYRTEAGVQAEALELLRASGPELDWTYLSPAPEIAPGDRSGHYLSGADAPVGARISVADYAVALLDEVETPAHPRQRFTVAS